ncbi:hypothetical protein ACFWWA_38800 [Streptomyces goshikiensis]|uniref:hypothetical protein n=1 Tax=Streptomyces goshikiensis TaxID=1942 RepID=UPI003661FDA3
MDSNHEMDPAHQVPEDGVDEKTVRALGALSKAYGFHQLTGTADFELGDAVRLLREAGREEQADRVEREILGRNVILGHWTLQIVEAHLKTIRRPLLKEGRLSESAGETHRNSAERPGLIRGDGAGA